eukprot:m.268434 g.268434  ORF g.268434 m.268434 type:complete len:102 (+) comp40527_c0_seq49:219-524(+)
MPSALVVWCLLQCWLSLWEASRPRRLVFLYLVMEEEKSSGFSPVLAIIVCLIDFNGCENLRIYSPNEDPKPFRSIPQYKFFNFYQYSCSLALISSSFEPLF